MRRKGVNCYFKGVLKAGPGNQGMTEKKIKRGINVPEGKIGCLGKEVGALALYSMLETCNHLKDDRVEVRTLLEPHLIKT